MVKTGYKQTEIGILPDAWDTITFENCFTILPNNTLSRAELNYNSGEVQNIHYGDILVMLKTLRRTVRAFCVTAILLWQILPRM